jgi:hypothetical protein
MKLHEFHARSLESAVSLADGAARRMERLILEDGQQGLIRPITNTLSPEARKRLLTQVRELHVMLAQLVEEFCLSARPLDIRQVLNAEVSALWVIFEDCRPSRMTGYGQDFPREADAALNGFVDRLSKHMFAMAASVH